MEEDPPGGLRSHGRSGRFAPFAPIAHSGPVSCVPASRELVSGGPLPLPSSGGGQATRAGLPPSAVPLPLPYIENIECFQPVYRRRWKHETSQVGKILSTSNARTHQCPIYVAGGTKNVHLRRFEPPPATRRWHTCDTALQRGGETLHNQHIRVTDGCVLNTRQLL